MVCGLQYTFIHTKHFQFIADKCASLHSQIFHAPSYPPRAPLRRIGRTFGATFFATFPILRPTLGLRCPSTNACKNKIRYDIYLTAHWVYTRWQ
jgi:hypothetical protein